MSNVKELIKAQENGTLCFGDYSLDAKTKLSDFPFDGDTYKVKTFKEITRLEKNGGVIYESVPGSSVHDFKQGGSKLSFLVEAMDDVQITLELLPETEYKVLVDDINIGRMKSNLGGKINFSISLDKNTQAKVEVVRL